MEKAQRHAVIGEHAVRAGIVERHHRLRAVALDHRGDARVHDVERLLPADARERAGAARAGALERMQQAVCAVDEIVGVMRHLGADDALGIGQGVGAAHFDDAAVVDRHGQAAGVRAVEGADAGALHEGHGRLRGSNFSEPSMDVVMP